MVTQPQLGERASKLLKTPVESLIGYQETGKKALKNKNGVDQ
jgi:hypothetical protein